MKGRMNTGMGEITINTDVIATYAGSVAVECFGIVGMAAVNSAAENAPDCPVGTVCVFCGALGLFIGTEPPGSAPRPGL